MTEESQCDTIEGHDREQPRLDQLRVAYIQTAFFFCFTKTQIKNTLWAESATEQQGMDKRELSLIFDKKKHLCLVQYTAGLRDMKM